MKDLIKESQEMLSEREGFADLINRTGKVPVGEWTFLYYVYNSSDFDMVKNSAEMRGMTTSVSKIGKILVITGDAYSHDSLIHSLQQLSVPGYVADTSHQL